MSIVSGESTIGNTGLAMARNTRQGKNPIPHDGSKREKSYLWGKLGYTADNLYLLVKQPETLSFFLSHATAYYEDYNYVHILVLPINSFNLAI